MGFSRASVLAMKSWTGICLMGVFILQVLAQSQSVDASRGLSKGAQSASRLSKGRPLWLPRANRTASPAANTETSPQPAATTYSLSSVNDPNAASTFAYGINNNGVIVGAYEDASDNTFGFVDQAGSFTTLDDPAGDFGTLATGIDDAGEVIGFTDQEGTDNGFLYSGGAFTVFSYPDAADTVPNGINNNGYIVGTYTDSGNVQHGFVYDGSKFTRLDYPDPNLFSTSANGVNNNNVVVGTYQTTGPEQGFVYSGGQFSTISYPGAPQTEAQGINDNGIIVGWFADSDENIHGFVDIGGTFSQIDYPGSAQTIINGVNNQGEITGYYVDASDALHGFVGLPATIIITKQELPDCDNPAEPAFSPSAQAPSTAPGSFNFGILEGDALNPIVIVPATPPGYQPQGRPYTAWETWSPIAQMAIFVFGGQVFSFGGEAFAALGPAVGPEAAATSYATSEGEATVWGEISNTLLQNENSARTVSEDAGDVLTQTRRYPSKLYPPNCKGDPVNPIFGSFGENFADFSISGRGVPLSFTHTYNSVFAATKGVLGYGWTHSYAMSLAVGSSGVVTISQENGSQVAFTPASGGGYTPPARVIAILVKNTNGTYTFTRRAKQIFTFSATGQLTSERDTNGYTTALSYNSNHQLTKVTDPAGRALTLTYAAGNLSSVADPDARKIQFAYDSAGDLTTVTDVNGGKTQFTYSAGHLLLTVTNPRGGVVTNTYDSKGRVTAQSDQLKRKTAFTYATGKTTVTDPVGNVVEEAFNSSNQQTSVTQGFGTSSAATWTFAYDPNTGEVTTLTDPNGHVSTTSYDSSGNPVTTSDGLGRVTTLSWDALNDLKTITDPLGVSTTLTYDSDGNLLTSSTPLKGGSKIQKFTYQYGDSAHPGDITGIVDPNGDVTAFTHDADGNPITTTDPLKHTTKAGYNGIGWLTSVTDARGKTATFTRNTFGDVTKIIDALGNASSRAYDANRNLTSATDAKGNVTTYTYDAANEWTTISRADGTKLQTSYNLDGTVAKTINGAGHATTYAYSPLARLTSVSDPLGRSTGYTYDAAGNQLTLTDPSANKTTKSYDAANELVGISYSDGKTHNVTMVYDADGQRTSITDGTGTSKWTYDSLHRITSTITGAGTKITYIYDMADQLIQLTYPGSNIVLRAYDADGRMTSVTDWLGNATTFAYDADGNLLQETLPSSTGIIAKYTYDAASRVSSIAFTEGTSNVASFSYKRDAMGQLTGVTESGVPTPGSDTVGYTKLNQLASVNSSAYSYSAANDITGLITPSQVTLNYDVSNELTTLTAGTATSKFSYDTRGNRLKQTPPTGSALAYTYDQANRMSAFGSNATYSSDGDGLRMSKKVGGVSEAFTWDRSGPSPLILKDGTTTYLYDANGLPLEQVGSSNTVLFYLHDQLGSTRLLSSTAGVVKGSYTYDAYGNLLGKTGSVANPFAYAGQYSDAESGLIYLRARYYDPPTAQFLSRDPLVDIYPLRLLYGYSQDNPLNESDPTGLNPRRR